MDLVNGFLSLDGEYLQTGRNTASSHNTMFLTVGPVDTSAMHGGTSLDLQSGSKNHSQQAGVLKPYCDLEAEEA